MAASLETRYLLGSVLAVLLVGAGFLAVSRFMTRANGEAAERRGLDQALQNLDQELSAIKDAETGQRGFLLTGKEAYLAPYARGRDVALDGLRKLPGSSGLEPVAVKRLDGLIHLKLDELARTVALAQSGRRPEALALVGTGEGLQRMHDIRDLVSSMAQGLEQRREARAEDLAAESRRLRTALAGTSLLTLASLVAGAWILARDLGARRAMEEGLRRSERRFRALAEGAPVGIYEYDFEQGAVYANRTHCELTGLPYGSVSRERFRNAVHPEDRERVLAHATASMGEGKPFDETYRLRHEDGAVLWVHSQGIPVEEAGGRTARYLIVTQDVTASLLAEEEIRAKAEALESANKELEAFAYSVSHDLRAPLRHIDGFVGLLRKSLGESVDERAKHQLQVISASARQMGALIDDLLSFSRMGRAEVRKTSFDLGTLVQRVQDELAPETRGREVEWQISNLPKVHADPDLLRLAFLNLVGNALKFTRGRETARIEISAREEEGRTAVTVKDNGAGFDMQYADKLFGVFQRLHRQDEFEGTGIGLANVARIIHRHGGSVSASGAVGQGAIFTFTLPREAS